MTLLTIGYQTYMIPGAHAGAQIIEVLEDAILVDMAYIPGSYKQVAVISDGEIEVSMKTFPADMCLNKEEFATKKREALEQIERDKIQKESEVEDESNG